MSYAVYFQEMNIIQAIILGIVQGLTEFIPVSSSGHLVVTHRLLDAEGAGLLFDVALHIGTLLALTAFFYKDIIKYLRAIFVRNDNSRIAWLLVFATLPAVIIGILLQSAAETNFRSIRLVAMNLILLGLVMLLAERYAARRKAKTEFRKISRSQALAMGVAQAAAIVPGVSRSGGTITAGLFFGLDRVSATRFSFLLAIPITFGAIIKVLVADSAFADVGGQMGIFVAGILAAALSGLVAIRFLISYLSRHSLAAFAYYRVALGIIVLLFLAG